MSYPKVITPDCGPSDTNWSASRFFISYAAHRVIKGCKIRAAPTLKTKLVCCCSLASNGLQLAVYGVVLDTCTGIFPQRKHPYRLSGSGAGQQTQHKKRGSTTHLQTMTHGREMQEIGIT